MVRDMSLGNINCQFLSLRKASRNVSILITFGKIRKDGDCSIIFNIYQWRVVTSVTGHAICMPKYGHENGYIMGN